MILTGSGETGTYAPVSLNFTFHKKPYSEMKLKTTVAVTLGLGAFPLHSVWAGMTASRYVRNVWLKAESLAVARSGQHRVDVLQCLGFFGFIMDRLILLSRLLYFSIHESLHGYICGLLHSCLRYYDVISDISLPSDPQP